MSGWKESELNRIGGATELEITSRRGDGSLRPYVTIWGVRSGDDIYIRSAYGSENPWFRRATAAGTGRVRAAGIERDVAFSSAPPDVHTTIDAAYQAKYDQYGPQIVGAVVGDKAIGVTLRLDPQQ
ncbi:DUF2255 family protein [Nocardia sp. KC 131]|uniref:DUF2255 family protein n=1 Tax=Nocardia arseniciresistens TaxID=3392119 RepID=UPI00398F245D